MDCSTHIYSICDLSKFAAIVANWYSLSIQVMFVHRPKKLCSWLATWTTKGMAHGRQ